jgi:Nucleotidyltransferase domain
MALADGPHILVLYGSRARGDYDKLSDIDMLSVGDELCSITVNESDPRLCVSHYSWAEFEAMHQYGSLFLHHLKTQSRPFKHNITGLAEYTRLMETLPGYKRAARDIESFRLSLEDVRQALASGDTTPEFELSALATTVRHSCILGCYLVGKPEFGRYAPVSTFCDMVGLPSQIGSEFVELYQFRMMIVRKAEAPVRGELDAYAMNWLEWSEDIVEEVAACYRRSGAWLA